MDQAYDGSLVSYRRGRFTLEHEGSSPRDLRIRLVSSTREELVFSTQLGELLRRPAAGGAWDLYRPEPSPRPTFYVRDGQGTLWWCKFTQGEFGRVKEGPRVNSCRRQRWDLSGSPH